jgi:hypothetical protein
MKYTINGKEWTEFEINKRCAALMQITVLDKGSYLLLECGFSDYNPCNNPSDTDAIIDKCWYELMKCVDNSGEPLTGFHDLAMLSGAKWEWLMQEHKCTKLVAACICYIEMQEET